jgi:hypothetical protein
MFTYYFKPINVYGRSLMLEAVYYPDKIWRPALEVCTEIHLALYAQ